MAVTSKPLSLPLRPDCPTPVPGLAQTHDLQTPLFYHWQLERNLCRLQRRMI